MERAGGQRSRPKVWQIPAFSRYQPSCGTPPKIGSEKRRLSLRSENQTVTDTGKCASATTPQSSSSASRQASVLSQKPPGKENESPFGVQDHGGKFRAGIITKSTIKRKKSSNLGYITNSEKKIIKRRLSGDYEEQLSSKKLFQPVISISSKVHPTRADVKNGVYDRAERSTAGSFGTPQVSESIGKVEGTMTKSESRGAGTPRCEILGTDPPTASQDLFSLWKSDYCRSRSGEADCTVTSLSESVEEKAKPGEPSARQDADHEISGFEFLIEKVDPNDVRVSAMKNCRRVKSGSDIGRLNIPLRKGEDVSPLKRRMNQLKKSASRFWQIPAFSLYQPSCSTSQKIGSEKRRLSLRSENKTITDTGKCASTTTPQSSSSSSQQASVSSKKPPGKENESPFGVQDHGGKFLAGIITKSTIKRKKSSNLGYITNSEKKIIKRRLSSNYEEQLSSKKLFQPVISISSKVHPTVADVKNGVYDRAERSTAGSVGKLQVSEPIEKVEGATAKSESRGAGTPRCEILGTDPSTASQDLFSLWKSDHCRSRSGEADCTVTPLSESVEEKAKPGEPSARQDADQEISGFEFLIEKVDRNDDRASAMKNCRRVKSGSDIGRLNIPLRKGEDVSPLKRRINQLKKSASRVGKSSGVEKETRKRHPAVLTIGDGSRKITPSEEAARTSLTTLYRQRANRPLIPAIDSKNVRSSRDHFGSGQKPRAIKSDVAISGLLNETPFQVQYATDYTKESISLEHAREENSYKISRTFLKEKSVTPEQRRIVVNFLISVHAYLLTSSSTLHQATKIFDAILDIKDVSVTELQLVALGASWIAIKNMETKVPTAGEMISFAKDMYHNEGPKLLCKCERKILKTLGFNIRFSDPFYVSDYYLQQWSSLGILSNDASVLRTIRHSAGYLIDVALLHESYSSLPSELLAAAAMHTAVHLVLNKSWDELSENSPWNKEKLTRCTQEEINRVAYPLIEGVLESVEKDSPIGAVYKKYKNPKCDNTSDYLVSKIKKLAN